MAVPVLPEATDLQTTVLYEGTRYNDQEPIALPNGSVFALTMVSNIAGHVQLLAVDPDGPTALSGPIACALSKNATHPQYACKAGVAWKRCTSCSHLIQVLLVIQHRWSG